MQRPTIRNLSKKEKEKRWAQHSASNRSTPKAKPSRQAPKTGLAPCSVSYRQVLANPFDAPPSCIPINPAVMTRKAKYFIRGAMATQTGSVAGAKGFGYVMATPRIANDNSSTWGLYHTEGSSQADVLNMTSIGVVKVNTNCEYPLADFATNKVMMRVVSRGIRIRYSGAQLSMSGTVYALEHPNHQSLVGKSTSDIAKFESCKITQVTRQWTTVVWQPKDPKEFQFSDSNDYSVGGHVDMAIIVQTAGGSDLDLPFEYEYFINVELIGELVHGKTRSDVDITGSSKVMASLGQTNPTVFDTISNYGFSAAGSLMGASAVGGLAAVRRFNNPNGYNGNSYV